MPKDYSRAQRIAEQIQREMAELIRLELKDPRVGLVTITGVEVTQDYEHAKVFFTLLGEAQQVADSLVGLQRAAGFLRSQLSRRMQLRIIPQLHFIYDESVERGIHLSKLIDEAITQDKSHPVDGDV